MTESVLKRNDKISLSGGKKVIWAPEFPRYAHKFGFWDYAYFLNYPVAPLYTVTILDQDLNEIPLNRVKREWLPSHLTQYYIPFDWIEFKEEKALLQNDVLVSRITMKNNSNDEQKFYAIVWTGQVIQENITKKNPEKTPGANFIQGIEHSERLIAFQRRVNNDQGNLLSRYGVAIGTRRRANSFSINTSEYLWNYPEWELTPFFEKMTPNGLPNDANFKGIVQKSDFRELLYMALEYTIVLPPKSSHEIHIYCAIRDVQEEAMEALAMAAQFNNPISYVESTWQRYFDEIPEFECSDPFFEKYYSYRWYGLKKNTVNTDDSFGLKHPCIFEGTNPRELRHQTSLSAPSHMLETRWMHDPAIAKGCLLNFIAHQQKDGSFPGIISNGYHTENTGFYHANWGRSIRELYRIHPDPGFIRQIYLPMKRYAQYYDRERDKNYWHLYDILSSEETGLEYSSRYMFAERRGNGNENFRMKGVDVSVYMYELYQTLAWMAELLDFKKEMEHWRSESTTTKNAILKSLWNEEHNCFFDIHPLSAKNSTCKSATSFYPFITDIAQAGHLSMIKNHLLNPAEFWTEFPVPTISMDDAYSNAYGEWENMRRARPSNGRTWMLINSHICEALAYTAQNLDETLKPKAAELISRTIKMLFRKENVKYPTAYEYYNPINGKPPYFRGGDDHINSWIVDLIIKYVVGLQPLDNGVIVIDPLPFSLDYFSLDNVRLKGHHLKIAYSEEYDEFYEKGFFVYLDGDLVAKRDKLEKVILKVEERF